MARARNSLIDLSETPYYHLCTRCVRRAFLTGEDSVSQRSYDHRRQWIVNRFRFLSDIFAIDICAYAVMSNHYHLVVKVDQHRAVIWEEQEVISRWYKLCRPHPLIDSYQAGRLNSEAQIETARSIINVWRKRLFDISWFMRLLNEHIARRANKEDNCTGRFWEGRFHSQALLDNKALLGCMAYVDLNPVRAGVTTHPEACEHTSIQQRIEQYQQRRQQKQPRIVRPQRPHLLPFADKHKPEKKAFINITFDDYLDLVKWTAAHIRTPPSTSQPPTLLKQTFGIETQDWLAYARHFRRKYSNFAGSAQRLYQYAKSHDHHWYKGVG